MIKKVAIIGAGLTGLSTGIQLQQHGIRTEIFEQAPWPGGVCTSWVRKGYTFDGCIHWMVGTRKGDPMRALYEKVHALEPDTPILHMDHIDVTVDHETHRVPLDVNSFQQFLLALAPADAGIIRRLCARINRVGRSDMIAGSPKSFGSFIHAITKGRHFLWTLVRFMNVTVGTYTEKMTDPRLVKLIHALMPASMSMFALLMMLGTRMAKNGGFPAGGSRDMIRRMADRYHALGGHITYRAMVTDLNVKDGKVIDLVANGETHELTHVVAASDMHSLLNTLLKGAYPHPVLDRLLKESPLFDPIMLISFGLTHQFDIPLSGTYDLTSGIETGDGYRPSQYHIRSFDFDPSFAPEGHSSVMVTLPAPFRYWHDLRETDPNAYKDQKNKIAADMADVLEQRYPGIKDAIAVIDVATPSTYYRLNHLHQGSYEGFLPSPDALKTTIDKQVPGIDNLYLAGQWVTPGGGIPTAIMSGIETANRIIKSR
jgi:phytoene desaturase